MEELHFLFGNLREVVPPPLSEFLLVLVSILCGAIVGAERERREKPAGLRTLTLICLGSTLFTMVSIDRAIGAVDPSRIAAQVVTGVGFLGAGAILRERGSIIGLTTAASIWVIAAVGIVVGAGYALSGLALSLLILLSLILMYQVENRYFGHCSLTPLRVVFRPQNGRTRVQIQQVLDSYPMPIELRGEGESSPGLREVRLVYCSSHKHHRAFLGELAAISGVEQLETSP